MYQYVPEVTETTAHPTRRRGRRPAASRDDVLATSLRLYLHGERVDVQAVAAELGLGRTTIYRWFGSREGLIGETVARAAEPLFENARAGAKGAGGDALLDTFDRINRALAAAPALRSFLELERDALRIRHGGRAGATFRGRRRDLLRACDRGDAWGAPSSPSFWDVLIHKALRVIISELLTATAEASFQAIAASTYPRYARG